MTKTWLTGEQPRDYIVGMLMDDLFSRVCDVLNAPQEVEDYDRRTRYPPTLLPEDYAVHVLANLLSVELQYGVLDEPDDLPAVLALLDEMRERVVETAATGVRVRERDARCRAEWTAHA